MSLVALCFLDSFASQADKPLRSLKEYRFFSVSTYNHTYNLPMSNPFEMPYNPGIAADYNFPLRKRAKTLWYQSLGLNYYHHKSVNQGVQLYMGLNFRHAFHNGLQASLGLNLGALTTYDTKPNYRINSEGEAERIKKTGRRSYQGTINVMLGYSLHKRLNLPFDVYFRYAWGLQAPFTNEIPLIPHNNLHVGVNYYPFR